MTYGAADQRRAQLAALFGAGSAVQRVAAPVVDLLVRLSLAKAFFAPGMLPSLHPFAFVQAAWPRIIVQVAGPVLLAVGLWVRPVALLMLGLTLLAQASGLPQDVHLFWAALFGWYLVQGAGPLSLDHLLAKGLGFSPLPLAGLAMAAAGWSDRHVAPLFRLGLRVWLAVAIADVAPAPTMLPSTVSAMLPHDLALAAAALLATGLATPLVAGGLLVAGVAAALPIYGPLLLGLLGVAGAGRFSLDHLIATALRRPVIRADDAPHVVIVGAGFGGMACASGLRHERVRVTLVDRQLSPFSAAAVPGRDLQPVAGRHRDAGAQRLPQRSKAARAMRQVSGVDVTINDASLLMAAGWIMTSWCSRPAPPTAISAMKNGRTWRLG